MPDEPNWYYEKLEADGKVKSAPPSDLDAKITGRHVYGLRAWFDENPEERIRLGWVKHITHKTKDIEYNKQTQYLQREIRNIDEYTVEDVYRIMDKSEEQMRLEELMSGTEWGYDDGTVITWGMDV